MARIFDTEKAPIMNTKKNHIPDKKKHHYLNHLQFAQQLDILLICSDLSIITILVLQIEIIKGKTQ